IDVVLLRFDKKQIRCSSVYSGGGIYSDHITVLRTADSKSRHLPVRKPEIYEVKFSDLSFWKTICQIIFGKQVYKACT
ncbi:MAG: hypothetical protein QXW81_06305, partial [Archaeoglobaceae archaeon]